LAILCYDPPRNLMQMVRERMLLQPVILKFPTNRPHLT
jgi:hypothetical protein